MSHKTIELIKSLNKQETRAFKGYITSEQIKNPKVLVRLFNCLTETNDIDMNSLSRKFSVTGRPSITQLRYMLSDLNKHLEMFLITRKLESDPMLRRSMLLKALANRNCDKAFKSTYSLQVSEAEYKNADTLLQKFEAEENRYVYFSSRQKRNVSLNYTILLFHLDAFYVAKKLQFQCELMSAKNLVAEESEVLLSREVALVAANSPLQSVPSVRIYYLLLQMLTDPENELHHTQVLSFINNHETEFPVEEVIDMYQYVKNYCIKKINSGNQNYSVRLFELYKIILANKRMMNHDYFSQWEFKNLVTISLRINEKEWCNNFIKKYINYLHPDERVNAYNYNMAYWYWSEKKYHLSLKLLQKVDFTDVVYQLDSRAVILKIYFETLEFDSLYYHLSAFRAYLRRNTKVAESLRIQYSNLIRYTTKIARYGMNKKQLEALQKELQNDTKVADKGWLDTQIKIQLKEKNKN